MMPQPVNTSLPAAPTSLALRCMANLISALEQAGYAAHTRPYTADACGVAMLVPDL
jgi:hypothetical protein